MQKKYFLPVLAGVMLCVPLWGCGTSGNSQESVAESTAESNASSPDVTFSYDMADSSFPDMEEDEADSEDKNYSENGSITFQDDAGKEYQATFDSNVPLKQDSNTSFVSKTSNTMVYFDVDSTHAENSMELFQEMAKENVKSDSTHVSTKEGQTDVGDSYFMECTVNDKATVYTYKIYVLDKTDNENPVLYEVTFDTYGEDKDSVEASDKDVEDFTKSLIFLAQ